LELIIPVVVTLKSQYPAHTKTANPFANKDLDMPIKGCVDSNLNAAGAKEKSNKLTFTLVFM
jgi:hypothetical protein